MRSLSVHWSLLFFCCIPWTKLFASDDVHLSKHDVQKYTQQSLEEGVMRKPTDEDHVRVDWERRQGFGIKKFLTKFLNGDVNTVKRKDNYRAQELPSENHGELTDNSILERKNLLTRLLNAKEKNVSWKPLTEEDKNTWNAKLGQSEDSVNNANENNEVNLYFTAKAVELSFSQEGFTYALNSGEELGRGGRDWDLRQGLAMDRTNGTGLTRLKRKVAKKGKSKGKEAAWNRRRKAAEKSTSNRTWRSAKNAKATKQGRNVKSKKEAKRVKSKDKKHKKEDDEAKVKKKKNMKGKKKKKNWPKKNKGQKGKGKKKTKGKPVKKKKGEVMKSKKGKGAKNAPGGVNYKQGKKAKAKKLAKKTPRQKPTVAKKGKSKKQARKVNLKSKGGKKQKQKGKKGTKKKNKQKEEAKKRSKGKKKKKKKKH